MLNMKSKENLTDELKKISPFLFTKKGEPEGFIVPNDYFQSLSDEVLDKLTESRQTLIEKRENWFEQPLTACQFYFQPRYVLAYAFVVLLLFAGHYFLNDTDNNDIVQPQLADAILNEVSDEILQAYIFENIDEFDESMLTDELADHSNEPLPELKLDISDELMDELIDDMEIDDLKDLL